MIWNIRKTHVEIGVYGGKMFWVLINVRITQMLGFRDRTLASGKLEKNSNCLNDTYQYFLRTVISPETADLKF